MRSCRATESAKFLQVLRGETAGGLAAHLTKALDRVQTVSAKFSQGAAGKLNLPCAEDLGMACQDLFDERRARSRQPYDEHRDIALQAKVSDPLEEIRSTGRDQAGDIGLEFPGS